MPNPYDGLPGNISFGAPLTVTNVTTGNPTVITIGGGLPAQFFSSSAYGYGPFVTTTGLTGYTSAINGTYVATIISGTQFSIPVNSIGTGAFGGTSATTLCQPLYMVDPVSGTGFTIPADGDADNAASIAAWAQITGDRTSWLAARTGTAKLAGRLVWTQPDLTDSIEWGQAIIGSATVNTWYALNSTSHALNVSGIGENGVLEPIHTAPPFGAGGVCGSQDAVHVVLDCDCIPSTADTVRFGLFYTVISPSSAVPSTAPGVFPTSWSQVPGASKIIVGDGSVGVAGLHLEGWIPNGPAGDVYVIPAVYSLATTGSKTWAVAGDTVLRIEVWRSNGMPQ